MQIVIDVPEQYLLDESAETIARRFKLYAALMLFRSGKISAGAACELAEVDRYSFLAACKEHSVPATSYPAEELEAEAEWLAHRSSTSS